MSKINHDNCMRGLQTLIDEIHKCRQQPIFTFKDIVKIDQDLEDSVSGDFNTAKKDPSEKILSKPLE